MILESGRPAAFALAAATSILPGVIMRNFASAVLSAKVISSTLYAGLAPLIFAPTRKPANMATGYQTVFWPNRETVSPALRPYFLTRAVEM
jgi:hypothetical protein